MDRKYLSSWVDDNRDLLIAFLQDLLRIPSVTGEEAAIQSFLADYLGREGFEVDVFVPSLDELK